MTAGHAAHLFASLSDAALYTYLPGEPPISVEVLRERYQRLETRRSPDGTELRLNWAGRQHNGAYVGLVEATVHADLTAHIAYFVFVPFQRQGFASEIVAAMLAHLKSDIGIREARALIDTRNEASWRLLERIGFRRVRLIRDADLFKGAPSDEFEYARVLEFSLLSSAEGGDDR
jgi:ribosomal-protein-alanine N-acetyltransferase